VQYLAVQGVTTTIECGPGKVLGGLIKRIDKTLTCTGIETGAELDAALAATR
jgi:[acyl-carrier-protein] S-malonyltransferase